MNIGLVGNTKYWWVYLQGGQSRRQSRSASRWLDEGGGGGGRPTPRLCLLMAATLLLCMLAWLPIISHKPKAMISPLSALKSALFQTLVTIFRSVWSKIWQLQKKQLSPMWWHYVIQASRLRLSIWLFFSCSTDYRVRDPHHLDADPDPAFHHDADPAPTFHSDADSDPITHFSSDLDPPMLQNDPLMLPPFHFDADPDPASQNHMDQDPRHCIRIPSRIRSSRNKDFP
jgi:hypothetical protein